MDPDARHTATRQALKRIFWAWTILASTAATIGGIIGLLSRENDDWPS